MLILDIETEENLQCGVTSGGGASGGGGGASSKKASGAPSRSAGQPGARALDAAFGELARRGTTGRVQNPTLSPAASTPRSRGGGRADGPVAAVTRMRKANNAGAVIKQLQAGATPKATKAPKAAKAPKATKAPTNVAQQNRDRIARQKAKAEKAKAKK